MEIIVQEQIKQHRELTEGIERANHMLAVEIGPSPFSEGVQAEWSLPENLQNGRQVQLNMHDTFGSLDVQFSAQELADSNSLRSGIRRLWIRLPQVQNETRIQKTGQLLSQMNSDGGG